MFQSLHTQHTHSRTTSIHSTTPAQDAEQPQHATRLDRWVGWTTYLGPPLRPPPLVPAAAGCCCDLTPVRHGLMNFLAPNSPCMREPFTRSSWEEVGVPFEQKRTNRNGQWWNVPVGAYWIRFKRTRTHLVVEILAAGIGAEQVVEVDLARVALVLRLAAVCAHMQGERRQSETTGCGYVRAVRACGAGGVRWCVMLRLSPEVHLAVRWKQKNSES